MQWNLILKFNDKNYEQHEMEFWLKNDEKYWSNQWKELATMIQYHNCSQGRLYYP